MFVWTYRVVIEARLRRACRSCASATVLNAIGRGNGAVIMTAAMVSICREMPQWPRHAHGSGPTGAHGSLASGSTPLPERARLTEGYSAAAFGACLLAASHSFIAASMVMNTAPPAISLLDQALQHHHAMAAADHVRMEGVGQDAEVGLHAAFM